MNLHNFTNGATINRPQVALTIDQVRNLAPSAFATEAHASRSERYAYIPTSSVIEAMMREGFQPFKASQGGSRIEGKAEFTKHMIRFRHPDMQLAKVGDTVPELVLVNSHDGTSAYKLMAGLFRLVCSNGLVVADSTIASLSVPHKGDVVNRVIEGSFEIVQQSRGALETTQAWSGLTLSAGEQNVFAEAAHTLRFADSEGKVDTPITVEMLLRPRRSADALNGATYQGRAANDLYKTFNVVQENAIRGGLSARGPRVNGQRGRMVTTREVKGIDQDVRLNRALWQLAERMAELKGVRVAA